MNECETTAGEFVGAAEDASEVSPVPLIVIRSASS